MVIDEVVEVDGVVVLVMVVGIVVVVEAKMLTKKEIMLWLWVTLIIFRKFWIKVLTIHFTEKLSDSYYTTLKFWILNFNLSWSMQMQILIILIFLI